MATPPNSCDAGAPAKPVSVERALDQLLEQAQPIDGTELLPTGDCLSRVLAKPVVSSTDLPYWDNSAMDGYAVRAADLEANERCLPVSQRIAAGHCGDPLEPGTAARIFTGAPVPAGADTVVVQEVCSRDGDTLRVNTEVVPGANIRRRGEELSAGTEVLAPGIRLGPQHLAMAAGVGVSQLSVHRRLKVAIFATGDELVMPGSALGPGQIYNSNRFLYQALLQALGCDVVDLGIIADNRDVTVATLRAAAEQADLVLASGGVSVGDEDHIRPAIEQLGRLDLWRVAMRPGKPLAFGHIGGTPFIGSPGNPVSLFVTFCLFARPFILRMQGIADPAPPRPIEAFADFEFKRPLKRRDYQRARITIGADGSARVQVFPNTSSSALSSLTWANGLAIVPEGQAIAAGDAVQFLPFSELLH
jgi:molybdopterin molybdotransferase